VRIVIVAGGTGGHLYPGIAVARELRRMASEKDPALSDVRFIVRRGDLGKTVLQQEGFAVHEIEGQGLPRSFNRRLLTFPFKFAQSCLQAFRLLKELKPDAVLGMGGYLTFPVMASASTQKIFRMIHEQNVLPGLTNRLVSRWVDRVALSFEESRSYFPAEKTWVSGLPIRSEIGTVDKNDARRVLNLAAGVPVALVFGGSLGAQALNQFVCQSAAELSRLGKKLQFLHITGERHLAGVQEMYRSLSVQAHVLGYCHQMAQAYAAADVVISRSGASTIAELEAAQRPAVLVPYPYASENHQLFNARLLEKRGQAIVIEEKNLTSRNLSENLQKILQPGFWSPRVREESNAAARLARALVDPATPPK
jgi:UDP-N-acetylglucosamine--N-acetylmuramyl-(pentapeptide) pyrophosphoryl-undecaprenol N-acetylglucosamine transferase